jgi:hypothetical protein
VPVSRNGFTVVEWGGSIIKWWVANSSFYLFFYMFDV